MESILVIVPTTARRLHLLKEVLESIYSNEGFNFKTLIYKNGKFSDEEYLNFHFGLPNVIKKFSSPGGHISRARNLGFNEIKKEEWVLMVEDDILVDENDWLNRYVNIFNSVENCGSLGLRLHGSHRDYNMRNSEYSLSFFDKIDGDTFETTWSDGHILYKSEIIKKHNLRYDEDFLTNGELSDLANQMSDLGYSTWRTKLRHRHYHIPGNRTGTDKWKYAEVDVDMRKCNVQLYLKWKDSKNLKIKWWIENDTKEEQEYLNKKSYMNKKVIYTTIIGGYDELVEPDYKPEGWDFVCFTDRELESDIWEIRKTLPLYTDNTRTARKHKLLAHRLFPDYEYSLWLDGNIKVKGDVNELLGHLDGCNYATYDHLQNPLDPRGCIYDEGSTILQLGIKNGGNYKDNPDLIKRQMERYEKEGYPKNNGLVVQMEVLRRHNETDVVDSMEDQWSELKYNSKREQLSFNYIAWKNNLKFSYIQGDSRDNKYFLNMGAHTGKK